MTIATTNHPERIDDAILNRPSRFDVKYTFELPTKELRQAFIELWIAKVHARMAATGVSFVNPEAVATDVAEKTEGWSFAFLKELSAFSFVICSCVILKFYHFLCRFVSFLLRIAHDKALHRSDTAATTQTFEDQLLAQVDQLAAQIIKSKDDIKADTSGAAHPSMFRGAVAIRGTRRAMPMFNTVMSETITPTLGPNF